MQFTTTTGPHDQMHLTPLLGEPPLLCPSLELWLVRSEIADRGPTLDERFTPTACQLEGPGACPPQSSFLQMKLFLKEQLKGIIIIRPGRMLGCVP